MAAATIKTVELNSVQKAAALITAGLSEEDSKYILVKTSVCKTTEMAESLLRSEEVAKLSNAASTDLLTAASVKLKMALQGIGATIKAHPILTAITIAGLAITGIIAAYKKWGPTQENLAKWLDESKQKVQESTQKIEEMESELEKVQSRMAELQAKGSLSVVEQKELDKLEQYSAQLEKNLELEKASKRIQNKDAVDKFVEWFDKDMRDSGEFKYSPSGKLETVDDAYSSQEHPWLARFSWIGGAMSQTSEEHFIDAMFDSFDKQIDERANATTTEARDKADKNINDILSYLNDKREEIQDEMGDVELEYTPNAKKGSDEEKVNSIIEYMDKFNDKLLLATQKNAGLEVDYDLVFNAALESSRFSEAAKQIEDLKKKEDGATRETEEFNKALYDVINSSSYKGSNLEKLINYLKDDLGFEIDISGEDKLMSLSSMFVQVEKKVKDATQSNLLFADSFSKMSAARKAFEEGLQNIETGTEDYESYAESYEKAMELLNKGYDLDNGVLMAHVERLMSDEQLQKLGYDADKVKKFLQEHLKGVFGDKDTNEPGNGLIDKIKKYAGENGKIYAKGKDGKPNKKRELASYKDGKWHISDDSKDIEELGKQFGMTTDEILACVKAMKTFSDVNLNDTDTIINKLKKEGKVYTATTEETDKNGKKKKKSAVNLTQLKADMESSGQYTKKDIYNTIQQLKNDKNIITVEIDAKTKSKKVAEELEELGILSGEKAGVKGHNQYKYRQVDDIDEATKALKKFGLTGQEAYEKLKKINIGDEDGKLLSDVEKIESVIKTFNSDFDIGKFKSINLQGEVPEGGKRTEIVNVIPLKEELEKKGYSSQFIDEYIKGLEQQKHVVTIDTSMEFTQKGDVTTIEDQLVAAGVATKGEDGKYTINVKETVTLLKNTGTDSDDVTTFLNNLKNAAEQDGSLNLNFSSNISSIEGEVQSVYSGVGELGDKVDGTSEKLVNLDNVELGNVTQQVNGLYSELNNSRSQADSLYQKLLTISQGEYEARIKVLTEGGATVSGTANDGKITHRTTGAQAASGTAYAGGNWGTAPGGKTLTGELG